MKIIVADTNLLIYALDGESSFNQKSRKIIYSNNYKVMLTNKNITEFCAVLSKNPHIDYQTINKELKNILLYFDIIFPSISSIKIFQSLIEKYRIKGNRIFDMEIVSIMLANRITNIATFNKNDFQDIEEISIFEA